MTREEIGASDPDERRVQMRYLDALSCRSDYENISFSPWVVLPAKTAPRRANWSRAPFTPSV